MSIGIATEGQWGHPPPGRETAPGAGRWRHPPRPRAAPPAPRRQAPPCAPPRDGVSVLVGWLSAMLLQTVTSPGPSRSQPVTHHPATASDSPLGRPASRAPPPCTTQKEDQPCLRAVSVVAPAPAASFQSPTACAVSGRACQNYCASSSAFAQQVVRQVAAGRMPLVMVHAASIDCPPKGWP